MPTTTPAEIAEMRRLQRLAVENAFQAQFVGFHWPSKKRAATFSACLSRMVEWYSVHELTRAIEIARYTIGDHEPLTFLAGLLAVIKRDRG